MNWRMKIFLEQKRILLVMYIVSNGVQQTYITIVNDTMTTASTRNTAYSDVWFVINAINTAITNTTTYSYSD